MYIESDSGKNLIMVLVQSHASIVYYIQFKETMSFHEDIEGRLRGDEKRNLVYQLASNDCVKKK